MVYAPALCVRDNYHADALSSYDVARVPNHRLEAALAVLSDKLAVKPVLNAG
jgi:hypothetical protein